jgi:phage shock protein C
LDQLHRSKRNRMIAGVAGGMAEFFDVDVALVRLIWVLGFFAGGIGFFAYIVCCIVIPEETAAANDDPADDRKAMVLDPDSLSRRRAGRRRNAGVLLIGLGLIFLVKNIIPWHYWDKSWPLILVALGLYILFRDHTGDKP